MTPYARVDLARACLRASLKTSVRLLAEAERVRHPSDALNLLRRADEEALEVRAAGNRFVTSVRALARAIQKKRGDVL